MPRVWTWTEIDLEPGPGASHEARTWLGFTFDLKGPSSIDADIALSEVVSHVVRNVGFSDDDVLSVTADRPPGAIHIEVIHPGPPVDGGDGEWATVLDETAALWGTVSDDTRTAIWFELALVGTGREFGAADDADLIERMSVDGRAADELVGRYDPLVERMVARYRRAGLENDDLLQVGREALLGAADRFDRSKGPFERFASRTISGTLKKHLRDTGWSVRPPRSLQELVLEIRSVESELGQRLGRAPTVAELTEKTGRSADEIARARRASAAFSAGSLDQPVEEGSTAPIDRLGGADDALDRVPSWAAIDRVIHVLDERDRTIVHLRYFEDLTQREIAERVGISQMHVSRLLRSSIKRMRDAVGAGSES